MNKILLYFDCYKNSFTALSNFKKTCFLEKLQGICYVLAELYGPHIAEL